MNTKKSAYLKVNVSKIKKSMFTNGLIQRNLADLARISPTTLSHILKSGTCKKVTHLQKIATALNIDINEIIIGK